MVRQRGALFDAIAPVRRAAALAEQRSPTGATELARSRSVLRRELRDVFGPELRGEGGRGDVISALEVAAGWDTWDQLRCRMGQPASGARRVMTRMLTCLLAPALPPTSRRGSP